MKILPAWLREFVDIPVDDRTLAHDVTHAGLNVEAVLAAADGQTVFEIEFTPNRVDAMNHYGVARDLSALYDRDLKPINAELRSSPAKGGHEFPIEIEDTQGCARYCARVIRGVKIGASRAAMAQRLAALDSSSISNAVDASNYTLQQMGHPTHAFDLDLLAGSKIIVRRARAGETLKTLDGIERKLHPEDLVIADAEKPVALAGVMGGFDSMITDGTRNVLIESAWFDPALVRRTARRHGLHTDASHRFERGADWGAAPLACDLVAELILKTAGGTLEGDLIDALARPVGGGTITLRRSEVHRHLGIDIPEADIKRILRRLGFGVTAGRGGSSTRPTSPLATVGAGGLRAAIAEEVDSYAVDVPTWRLDVTAEIDLIEEIARIYGYNNFPNTLPAFSGGVVERPEAQKHARMRDTLLALGYNEAISLTFISPADAQAFSRATPVALANPLSDEASVLRSSLVPGMLDMLAWNLNRGVETVRLFEIGHVFHMADGQCEERQHVAIGATRAGLIAASPQGARPSLTGIGAEDALGFLAMKGIVQQVLGEFEYGAIELDRDTRDYFHPGRRVRVRMDEATVARFGEVDSAVTTARKLRQPVYIAEILLHRLAKHALRQPRFTPVPRYPAVDRDFSFIFPGSVTFERVWQQIEALKITEVRLVEPRERWSGDLDDVDKHRVTPGEYVMLLRVNFQSPDRTLRDDEVMSWSQMIVAALEEIGGKLRGKQYLSS
jgi:phenylalanyl-tRNA synthetase beta chain